MNQFATYEDENIHYWTNRSSGYSSVNQEELASQQKNVWGRQISSRIAARFPGRKPETIRVLDVGTGPGFFAIILAQMGYQVTAVDYTASMLEEARHNAGAFVGRIQFRQMNAEALCFASDSFDVVVTRNVTWNLHNPEQAYAHWTRVLAPGGLLFLRREVDRTHAGRYTGGRCFTPQEGLAVKNFDSIFLAVIYFLYFAVMQERMWMPWRQSPGRPPCPGSIARPGIWMCCADWAFRPVPMKKSGGRSGQRRSALTTPPPPCSW